MKRVGVLPRPARAHPPKDSPLAVEPPAALENEDMCELPPSKRPRRLSLNSAHQADHHYSGNPSSAAEMARFIMQAKGTLCLLLSHLYNRFKIG